MKILYIESKKKFSLENKLDLKDLIGKTPKNLLILYTIQYQDLAKQIYSQLKNHKRLLGLSQALGCSIVKTKADAILFITDGRFHAIQLAFSSGKEVYVYNGTLDKITQEEITKHEKKEKGKLIKFYSSSSFGLIVSLKPGQNKLEQALKFQEKLAKKFPEKKVFIFLTETLNLADLENFPIECWINFACPGISLDSNLINYDRIPL